MQEISGGSAGDSKIDDHEGRCLGLKVIIFFKRKTKETEDVMQPFNRFSMNTSLDRSQILNYTTDFHFSRYEVGVLLTCKHFKLAFLKSPSIYSQYKNTLFIPALSYNGTNCHHLLLLLRQLRASRAYSLSQSSYLFSHLSQTRVHPCT